MVGTQAVYGFSYCSILPVIFGEDIFNALSYDLLECVLEEIGDSQFPLHSVADNHEEFLGESLEHEEIIPCIIGLATIGLDTIINFLKETVRQVINLCHHLLTFVPSHLFQ